ncbi:hypothetical protein IFM61606_03723 [Aspergillus udagawae]|nr:hypothetical protein IFM61606_03723 [Aspergillus udagawae]
MVMNGSLKFRYLCGMINEHLIDYQGRPENCQLRTKFSAFAHHKYGGPVTNNYHHGNHCCKWVGSATNPPPAKLPPASTPATKARAGPKEATSPAPEKGIQRYQRPASRAPVVAVEFDPLQGPPQGSRVPGPTTPN